MNPYPQFDTPNPPPISHYKVSEAPDQREVPRRLLDKFSTAWPKLYTVEDWQGSSFTIDDREADGTNVRYELGITPVKVTGKEDQLSYAAYLVFLYKCDDGKRVYLAAFRIMAEIADSILSVLKVEGQQALIAWKHICSQGMLKSYAVRAAISATGIFPDGHMIWLNPAVSYVRWRPKECLDSDAPEDPTVKKPSHDSYFLLPNYVYN